jgi:hypothetical protein
MKMVVTLVGLLIALVWVAGCGASGGGSSVVAAPPDTSDPASVREVLTCSHTDDAAGVEYAFTVAYYTDNTTKGTATVSSTTAEVGSVAPWSGNGDVEVTYGGVTYTFSNPGQFVVTGSNGSEYTFHGEVGHGGDCGVTE